MKTSSAADASELGSAKLLSAVADPVRLRILHELAEAPQCACDMQKTVPLPANLLSYHLRILRQAGLVSCTRRGRCRDYALTHDAVERLHAALPSSAQA